MGRGRRWAHTSSTRATAPAGHSSGSAAARGAEAGPTRAAAPARPLGGSGGGAVGDPAARGSVPLPIAGATAGRRLLLLRALSPRSLDQGSAIPFMDVAEMEVTAVPPA